MEGGFITPHGFPTRYPVFYDCGEVTKPAGGRDNFDSLSSQTGGSPRHASGVNDQDNAANPLTPEDSGTKPSIFVGGPGLILHPDHLVGHSRPQQ